MMKKKQEKSEISFLVTGDVCPVCKIDLALKKGKIEHVFGDTLEMFRNVDISILNLEAPAAILLEIVRFWSEAFIFYPFYCCHNGIFTI